MVVLKKISEDSRSWDWHDDRFWQDSQLAMASSGRPTTADETRLESPKFSGNFSCVQPLIYMGMDPGWVKPGPLLRLVPNSFLTRDPPTRRRRTGGCRCFSPLGRQDRPRQSNTKSCAAPQDGYQLAEASPAMRAPPLYPDSFSPKIGVVLCQTALNYNGSRGKGTPLIRQAPTAFTFAPRCHHPSLDASYAPRSLVAHFL